MPEFRIETDALKREARFRILSWGTVLLLVVVAAFLLFLHVSGYIGDSSDIGGLFVSTILSAAIIAIILAPREGLLRAERKMVFAIDDKRIIRKRQGYPDVEIAFSEIETLREEVRWLVVTSIEPHRKIAVPNNVRGYELIRTELTKHHPLSARVVFPSKPTALLISVALLMASILSWAVMLWAWDVRVVILAAIVALIALAFGSYRLWTLLRHTSKRPLLLTSLGFAWLVALFLIYLRMMRH